MDQDMEKENKILQRKALSLQFQVEDFNKNLIATAAENMRIKSQMVAIERMNEMLSIENDGK